MNIRRAGPDDESLLRAIRLEALSHDPDAFGSTYEAEIARTPEGWQRWLNFAATFFLEGASGPIGIVVGLPDENDPSQVHLVSMWLNPVARGTGSADRLIAEVVSWARERGAERILLHVEGQNLRARRLYQRNGFRANGVEGPGRKPGWVEVQMCRELRGEYL